MQPSAPLSSELSIYPKILSVSSSTCPVKMKSFFDKVLNAMDSAIKIAPNLRNIIASIVRPCNGSAPSEAQIELLRPNLLAFQRKMLNLKLMDTKIVTIDGKIDLDAVVADMMLIIKKLNNNVETNLYEPLLINLMLGSDYMDPSPEMRELFDKSKGEFVITELLTNHRPDSIEPAVNRSVVEKIVEDAILGICRIMPNRKLGLSGTLTIQNINRFITISLDKDFDPSSVPHYLINTLESSIDPDYQDVHEFIPKTSLLDDEIAMFLYDKKLTEMTVYDLYRQPKNVGFVDDNFGNQAVWTKILGSSITSVSSALELLIVIGESLFERHHIKQEYRSRFKDLHLPDILDIVQLNRMQENVKSGLTPRVILKIMHRILKELTAVKMGVHYLGVFGNEIDVLFGEDSEDAHYTL